MLLLHRPQRLEQVFDRAPVHRIRRVIHRFQPSSRRLVARLMLLSIVLDRVLPHQSRGRVDRLTLLQCPVFERIKVVVQSLIGQSAAVEGIALTQLEHLALVFGDDEQVLLVFRT